MATISGKAKKVEVKRADGQWRDVTLDAKLQASLAAVDRLSENYAAMASIANSCAETAAWFSEAIAAEGLEFDEE